MATLVLLLPARPRGDASASAAAEYRYALTHDGSTVASQGRAAPSLLPKADSVVAVMADRDLSWHRIAIPKAPATKLPAAIAGAIEDQLLDDTEQMHFALAPGAGPGQTGWVATLRRDALKPHLEALEQAGVEVERVVPAAYPDETALAHFAAESDDGDGSAAQTWLVLSDAEGVRSINLAGALARSLLPTWAARGTRFSASPAVAAQAERWLGASVLVLSDAERAVHATRTLWNLRQFDLALRHRGMRALRDGMKRLRSPTWRPVRWGLGALVVLQLIGLNLWAWQLERGASERRQAMAELMKTAHPQVRAYVDLPAQMAAETARLRAAAGVAGPGDFESLLDATARAWPAQVAPLDQLKFDGSRLSIGARGLAEPQIAEIGRTLAAGGWRLESQDGRLIVAVAAGGRP